MTSRQEAPGEVLAGKLTEIDAALGQADQAAAGIKNEEVRAAFLGLMEELRRARNTLKTVGDEMKNSDE